MELRKFTKNHCIVYFEWVSCKAIELYFKTVKNGPFVNLFLSRGPPERGTRLGSSVNLGIIELVCM